ncbi:MAG: hypothetical protein IT310_08260 [Anaerolineales bacterium]|nr:hypothetical protein [Anaerolineales bacterium]
MNVPNVTHYIHAYKVAPWRIQIRWAGSVSLAVLAATMVASLFLYVSSRTAVAGREIQNLNAAMVSSQQVNTDLQMQAATLTSASAMSERAVALGFEPALAQDVEYLVVPGYARRAPAILASAELPQMSAPTVPHEYNESLLEWLDQKITMPARGLR